MSELPSEPERCPYTWEKCWLMTIKGKGICKGCKHGEYAVIEKGTIKKLDEKVKSDVIVPEKVVVGGKNSDSRCQITGKPCEMIATAGLRWCEGCKINHGTTVIVEDKQDCSIPEQAKQESSTDETLRFEKNNSKRESRKSKKQRTTIIDQNEETLHRTMENNIPKSVRSKVPIGHKKVGLWQRIRNLFR